MWKCACLTVVKPYGIPFFIVQYGSKQKKNWNNKNQMEIMAEIKRSRIKHSFFQSIDTNANDGKKKKNSVELNQNQIEWLSYINKWQQDERNFFFRPIYVYFTLSTSTTSVTTITIQNNNKTCGIYPFDLFRRRQQQLLPKICGSSCERRWKKKKIETANIKLGYIH